MKKLFLSVLLLFPVVGIQCEDIPVVGQMFTNNYVSMSIGANNPKRSDNHANSQKVGFKGGLMVGTKFSDGFNGELEVGYRSSTKKKRHTNELTSLTDSKEHVSSYSWAYMVNALYDFTQIKYRSITPYAGIGVGYCVSTDKVKVQYDTHTTRDKIKDDRFAYQGILGAKYPIDEYSTIGIQYNYFCGKNHQKDHSVNMALARSF